MAKKENRTNMDITLLFLAKPLDKHGIMVSYHLSVLGLVTAL